MKKFIVFLLSVSALSLLSNSSLARDIISSENSSILLSSNGENLNISGSGDLSLITSSNPAVLGTGRNLTISINVDDSAKGITSISDHSINANNGAISIQGSLSRLELIKGKIQSIDDENSFFISSLENNSVISLNSNIASAPEIYIGTEASISRSTSTIGKNSLISSSSTYNTNLLITNDGRIEYSNAMSTDNLIELKDSDGGSSLLLNNNGLISIFGFISEQPSSIFLSGSGNEATIINTGTIDGSINIENNELELSNSGDITGNLFSSGSGSFSIMSNGKIDGRIYSTSGSISILNFDEITDDISTDSGDIYLNNFYGSLGSVSTNTGKLNFINTGGTLTGSINLGTNIESSIEIYDGELVGGNISMNNSNQTFTYNGGVISNTINGPGKIIVASDITLVADIGSSIAVTSIEVNDGITLDSNTNDISVNATNIYLGEDSVFTATNNNLVATIDGSAANSGIVNLITTGTNTVDAVLGSTNGLAEVNIGSDFDIFSINNSIKALQTTVTVVDPTSLVFSAYLQNGLNISGDLKIGSNLAGDSVAFFLTDGSSVSGDISGVTDGKGYLGIFSNSTVESHGDFGTSSNSLETIEIESLSVLTMNSGNNINATNLIIHNANLITSDEVNASITLDDGAIINLGNGGSITGSVESNSIAGHGMINTYGNVTIAAPIGATLAIDEINIDSASTLSVSNSDSSNANIIGADVNVSGRLNLVDATSINGDVFMMGSSSYIDSGNYSHEIDGDFSTDSGSTIAINVASNSSADKFTVSGMAILDANTKLNVTISSGIFSSLTNGTSYTILSGGTGSTLSVITDGNINVNSSGSNIVSGIIFQTMISGNDLLLRLTVPTSSPSDTFSNSNIQSAYNAVTSATSASGNLSTLKTFLEGGAAISAKGEAAKSASNQADNSSNRIAFNNIDNIGNLISSRIEAVKSGVASGDAQKNKSMWMQAMGGVVKQGNTTDVDGYDAKTAGFAFGFDREISEQFVLGLSGAYSHSNINGRNSSKDTFIDSYQISAYGGYDAKSFFINGVIGASFNEYKSRRQINVASAQARAEYSGQSYFARLETGKNFAAKNGFTFTPLLTLTAAKNTIESYDETGAGTLNLHVRNDDANFLETRAGARISQAFKMKSGAKFVPQLTLSYGYDFAGSRQKSNLNFIGQNANFSNTSARLAQGSFKVGTGVEFFAVNDMSVSANYIYENRNQYSAHSGWLKAKYAF